MLGNAKVQAMVGTGRADIAKVFYGETLGLKLKADETFAMIFATGGGDLRVNRVPAVAPSTYAVLGFHVTDISGAVRGLAAKGVVFERYSFLPADSDGVWTAPDGTKVAWFRDPDGNLLSVVQVA